MKLAMFAVLYFVFVSCASSQNIDMTKTYKCTGSISEYGSAASNSYCKFTQQNNNLTIEFSPDGKKVYTMVCQKDADSYMVTSYNGAAQSGSLILRAIHHPGSSGGTYVNGYRRKNGTYVSGYWRGGRPSQAINGFEIKLSLADQATVSYYFVE